ncbi:MAG TPA: phage holin family protein [Polyangiaceae bacterium]|nr:phage holin family protein [Polyangiaceae bacterium]
MPLLISWLSLSLALYVTSLLVPGFRIEGPKGALVVGALFGVLNWGIGWLLFGIIGISTLFIGFIFAFVTWWIVGAILLKLTDALSNSLSIDRFSTALVASAVLSLVSAVERWLFR